MIVKIYAQKDHMGHSVGTVKVHMLRGKTKMQSISKPTLSKFKNKLQRDKDNLQEKFLYVRTSRMIKKTTKSNTQN